MPVPLPLDDAGFVDCATAGMDVCGEFRCSNCRYGAVVRRELPSCPMCGGAVRESRPPRLTSLVLYTDGVVEARRDGELYGDDRLDALLAERHGVSARSLAAVIAEDAREFAGGDLSDDLAVVVIRKT